MGMLHWYLIHHWQMDETCTGIFFPAYDLHLYAPDIFPGSNIPVYALRTFMAGQYIIKNIVIISAGIVLWQAEKEKSKRFITGLDKSLYAQIEAVTI